LQVAIEKARKGSDSLSILRPAKVVGSGTIVDQDEDVYPRSICFLIRFSYKDKTISSFYTKHNLAIIILSECFTTMQNHR
jgi:hypothetical protein